MARGIEPLTLPCQGQRRRLETDLVDPLFKHRHRMTFAISGCNRLFLMPSISHRISCGHLAARSRSWARWRKLWITLVESVIPMLFKNRLSRFDAALSGSAASRSNNGPVIFFGRSDSTASGNGTRRSDCSVLVPTMQ